MTQQLQSSKAARIRSRSSSWGYGGIVGSQLDGHADLEIWIAGGEVGAAAAPPVEQPHGHTSFWDPASVNDAGSATLKERTLVVSLLILMSPLLILASGCGRPVTAITHGSLASAAHVDVGGQRGFRLPEMVGS
jgi:hypothetical protein